MIFCREAETRKYCCFKRRDFPSEWLSDGYRTLERISASASSCMLLRKFPSEKVFMSKFSGFCAFHRRRTETASVFAPETIIS